MKKKKRAESDLPKATPVKRPRPYLMISQGCFENYFWLAGPGRIIALDALSEGVVSTSYEAVDVLCLANQMFEKNVHALIVVEMAHRGRAIDYRDAKTSEEVKRLTAEAFEVLGDDRFREILRLAEALARKHLGVPEARNESEWLPSFLTAPVN